MPRPLSWISVTGRANRFIFYTIARWAWEDLLIHFSYVLVLRSRSLLGLVIVLIPDTWNGSADLHTADLLEVEYSG